MKGGVIAVIILIAIVVVVGAVLLFKNPYSNSTGTQSPPTGSSTGNSVVIKNFAFSPKTITIKAGEEVVWKNEDSVTHTITSDSGSELGSGNVSPGGSYSHTFTTPGTYNYHCGIHTSMKGTIIVE